MAGTKITFHQTIVRDGTEIAIPHVKSGFVQVFEGDFLSAGGGAPEYSVCYAVIEPLSPAEEKAAGKAGEGA